MIEREFILQRTKEFYIKKYIENKLKGVGISQIKLKKIPLGEKIIIHASRPSMIVGSKGSNIKDLTRALKQEFHLENPQIEINEVKDIFLDANIVAQRIASSLERFGSARFKSIGHKVMENVLNSGALGVELVISGKIPGARAKSWRFYQGYLKKCGDIALTGVRSAQATALLKSGVIGVKVAIMPPGLVLPDDVEILSEPVKEEIQTTQVDALQSVQSSEETKKKAPRKKSSTPKKSTKGKKKETETAVESTPEASSKTENVTSATDNQPKEQ